MTILKEMGRKRRKKKKIRIIPQGLVKNIKIYLFSLRFFSDVSSNIGFFQKEELIEGIIPFK